MKIWNFETTAQAYGTTQTDDVIEKGDVLIIESEKCIGLADCWPVAVTAEAGELHHLEGAWTLTRLGYSDESILRAVNEARERGYKLFEGMVDQVAAIQTLELTDERLDQIKKHLKGKRFAFVGTDFGLALVIEGQSGRAPIPLEWFRCDEFNRSNEYAQQLNKHALGITEALAIDLIGASMLDKKGSLQ